MGKMGSSHAPCIVPSLSLENPLALQQRERVGIVQDIVNHVDEPWAALEKNRQGNIVAANLDDFDSGKKIVIVVVAVARLNLSFLPLCCQEVGISQIK